MGDESAHAWMEKAIRGEQVPADQRDAYNPVTVFGVGSANICVLNYANDLWFAYHHERHRVDGLITAGIRYFDCKGRFYHGQSEPFGTFRYCQWQTKSLVAWHGFAQHVGHAEFEDLCARWLRYRIFTFGIGAVWWKYKEAGLPGTIPGPYAGSRSWVGPEAPGGGRPVPYQGVPESGGIAADYSNVRGSRREANWEVEPTLQALEDTTGYRRWNCISDSEIALLKRVSNIRLEMSENQLDDLQELLGLIEETGFLLHVGVHIFRTTKGAGMVFERSWSSGSTNMKYGGVVIEGGRLEGEYRESWAGDIDKQFGWLSPTSYDRRSDPGGTGSYRVLGNRVLLGAQTGPGDAANGFEPGEGKHWEEWRGGPRDSQAWRNGPREITLPGELVAHVHLVAKKATAKLVYPQVGDVDPPSEPAKSGLGKLRKAREKLDRAIANWGNDRGPVRAREARRRITEAIEIRKET